MEEGGKIPVRQDLTVLPADKESRGPIGWVVKEVIGIAIVNSWVCMPWYKKIFKFRFWKDLFRR